MSVLDVTTGHEEPDPLAKTSSQSPAVMDSPTPARGIEGGLCPFCGAPVEPSFAYCPKCGGKI